MKHIELTFRLVTASELARHFAYSPRTIHAWAKTGVIPFVRMPNGRRRYRIPEVEAALLGGDEKAASGPGCRE